MEGFERQVNLWLGTRAETEDEPQAVSDRRAQDGEHTAPEDLRRAREDFDRARAGFGPPFGILSSEGGTDTAQRGAGRERQA